MPIHTPPASSSEHDDEQQAGDLDEAHALSIVLAVVAARVALFDRVT